MRRRRLWITAGVVIVVLVLSTPLWLGYFGPETGAYATIWRPWRSHITVRVDQPPNPDSSKASLTVQYRDPWPGAASEPGGQIRFVRMRRVSPLLPWVVVETGTGP